MSSASRFKLGLGATLALFTLLSACAFEAYDDTDLESQVALSSQALFPDTNKIWQQLEIPVCWINPTVVSAARRGWVQNQVATTWEASSLMRFTGWGTCPATSKGIRIRIAEAEAHTVATGNAIDGLAEGMVLNLTMASEAQAPGYPACVAKYGLESCVRAVSVHEFGHALGFAHEQLRSDNPNFDCFILGGERGDVRVGAYDKLSIMRTCNPQVAQRTLSASDKLGLQAFYGAPAPAAGAAKIRKGAVKWDSDTLQFFFGSIYTRYSISKNRIVDLYPSTVTYPNKIAAGFSGVPAAWAADGFDDAVRGNSSKVFLFRGDSYIQYDVAANKADGAPKKITSAWKNWPAAWTSFDAAIRYDAKRIYFFRGSQYIRYDVPANCATNVDVCGTVAAGFPKAIAGNWAGLTWTDIDYISEFDDTPNIYFFKGSQYVRYSKGDANQAEGVVGAPKGIVGRWKGVTF